MEPPKKPAAAPFFLPTLAGVDAGRNPVFDFGTGEGEGGGAADPAAEAALAAKAAAAWGDGEEDEAGEGSGGEEEGRVQDGAADATGSDSEGDEAVGAGGRRRQRPPVGRVLRTHAQAEHSHLVRLLHACARSGDWTSLVAHLRALPPVALDAELRSMQVRTGGAGVCSLLASRRRTLSVLLLPGSRANAATPHPALLSCPALSPSHLCSPPPSITTQVLPGAPESELEDLSLLLQFLEEETAASTSFEFTQALLRVVLQVHGGTVGEVPELRARAARAQARLAASWRRLDALLQSTRCIVGYLGNLQA